MKMSSFLMLVPIGLIVVGRIITLSSSPVAAPQVVSTYFHCEDYTCCDDNGCKVNLMKVQQDLWTSQQARMYAEARIAEINKEKADSEAQEKFANSPQGRKMKELEMRVESAELNAIMAVGMSIPIVH